MSKAGFYFLLLYMLLHSSVAAQCGQRDIGGTWDIWISGTKAVERLNLTQSGTNLSGRADLQTPLNPYKDGGKVTGHVEGEKVTFVISWRNDSSTITESFTGTFGQDGTIRGQARIWALAGSVDVEWTSDRAMKCLYNAVKRLGVKPSNPADQAGPTASTSEVPWIVATPNNIFLPRGIGVAQTTLMWDGGIKHPYAEVWVKVDDQNETKLLERGKGTLPVVVVPGKTYLYILTDAGTTLATVTVRFQQ
jgi:hypothetical protein